MDTTDLNRLRAAITAAPESLCTRVCSHIAFNEHHYFPRFRENYDIIRAASHLARAYVSAYIHVDGALDAVIERLADANITFNSDATDARINTALVTYIASLACDQATADLDLVITDNNTGYSAFQNSLISEKIQLSTRPVLGWCITQPSTYFRCCNRTVVNLYGTV